MVIAIQFSKLVISVRVGWFQTDSRAQLLNQFWFNSLGLSVYQLYVKYENIMWK